MLLIAAMFGLTFATVQATPAYAVNTDAACEGIKIAGGACDDSGQQEVTKVIKSIINILSIIVGAISVIMIVIGGFRYIISGGDSNATAAARNTIIYALVGLAIVIFAQAIVAFVINRIS